ncbi:MAG: hypothetical protein ACE5OW_08120 [Candidatus Bathyarchaeia archaeon]
MGAALIKYGEVQVGVTIVFAEGEDTPVLGATALEALGFQVDPVTKQLKPVELLMIGSKGEGVYRAHHRLERLWND